MAEEMEMTTTDTAPAETVEAQPSSEEQLDSSLEEIYARHTEEGDTTEADAQPETDSAKADVVKPQQEAQAKPADYPKSWGKDMQEMYATLPPEVQAQIAKREEERERVVQQSFNAVQLAKAMSPIAEGVKELEPYFKTFRKADGTPLWGDARAIAQEIKDVLAVKELLFRDPAAGMQAVRSWAEAAGLKFDDNQNGGQWQSPEVLALRQRLAQLEANEQRRTQNEQQQQAQARQAQAVNAMGNHLESLGSLKDAAGNASYPLLEGEHGEALGNIMGRWMRANAGPEGITPQLFKEAYEAAVFSLPETREMEFKRREDARVAQFKQRSEAARKAQGINPRHVRSAEVVEKGSLDDTFNKIWQKYNS